MLDQPKSKSSEENDPISLSKSSEVDGGYGWVCVIAQLLITANTWGINGAFGVYLGRYIETNAFPGTSEVTYAFIGGLSISQITFIASLVTLSTQKIGTHTTLAIGLMLETGALVASSFATKTWHLFLTQGAVFGWGCSFLYVGTIAIIPQWFTRRRSTASAIAAAGSGLGGMCYSLGTEAMIRDFGVSWSFRITAIVSCFINTICVVLMRDRNEAIKPKRAAFDKDIAKRIDFLLIMAWSWLSVLGYTIILFSLPDNALRIGLTASQGSIALAVANLGMAIGRPIVGYFSDHIGRVNMICVATGLTTIFSFCIWTQATSYGVLITFAFLGGTTFGTFYAVIAPLLTECLGIKNLPAALSMTWTSIVLPGLFASPIALELRSNSRRAYLPVQLFTGGLFLAATVFAVLLKASTRKSGVNSKA